LSVVTALFCLQKASQWVASAFGDFEEDLTQNKPKTVQSKASSSLFNSTTCTKKISKRSFQDMSHELKQTQPRNKSVDRRLNKGPETSLWSEKYTPTDQVQFKFVCIQK